MPGGIARPVGRKVFIRGVGVTAPGYPLEDNIFPARKGKSGGSYRGHGAVRMVTEDAAPAPPMAGERKVLMRLMNFITPELPEGA